jgi:hypothetical protein
MCESTVSAACIQRYEYDLQISKRNVCKKLRAVALGLFTAELAKNKVRQKRERRCGVAKNTKLGERENACTIQAIHMIRGHHCGRVVRRAAETVLVYSEYITAYTVYRDCTTQYRY